MSSEEAGEFADGIIDLLTERGDSIGFTVDRFHDGSYLWKKGDAIIISFIWSRERGNFRELVRRIHELGLAVEVPTPMGRMAEIVKKNGYIHTPRYCPEMESNVDVWRLEPVPPALHS